MAALHGRIDAGGSTAIGGTFPGRPAWRWRFVAASSWRGGPGAWLRVASTLASRFRPRLKPTRLGPTVA